MFDLSFDAKLRLKSVICVNRMHPRVRLFFWYCHPEDVSVCVNDWIEEQSIPEYFSFACEGVTVRVHGLGLCLVDSWYTTIWIDMNTAHLISRVKPLIPDMWHSDSCHVESWI